MYAEYWGLRECPFAGPDETRWFHESPVHEEALARLLYLADQGRGCGLLIGPAGTGKSLLLDFLRQRRGRAGRETPRLELAGRGERDILWELAANFGLAPADADGEFVLWRNIRDHLEGLRMGRVPVLLAFDDADRAEPDALRAIERLLAETRDHERLTLFLAARSEGRRRLPDTLREQCDLRIELTPLDWQQTALFVLDLLGRAGCERDVFDDEALAAIHDHTGGVPRRIRRLCDLALLAGMSDRLETIDADVIHAAAEELEDPVSSRIERRPLPARF